MSVPSRGSGPSLRDVQVESVEALVHEPDGGRLQRRREGQGGRLRPALVVEQPPAGAGDDVAEPEHDAAAAAGLRAAPLPEHVGHHLARDPLRVGLGRVRAVPLAQVVLPHVGEVPVRTAVPRYAAGHHRVGEVAERQALGGEPHLAVPCVRQVAEVGADAEVLRDPGVDADHRVATGRRRVDPHRVEAGPLHQGLQQRGELGGVPGRRADPEHRRLLLVLGRAADHGRRRVRPEPDALVRDLDAHVLDEVGVGERVVEGREHQVLPHQQPQLVAAVVEVVGLVRRDAGHADHVQSQPDRLVERSQVARRPHGSAAEHPDAVDPEVQGVLGPVLDGPEPDPPHHLAVDRHVVEPRSCHGCAATRARPRGTRPVAP